MVKSYVAAIALLAVLSLPATAQDAKTILSDASKAMGADNLTSVMFYGSGANFNLGQSNNANGPWPRINLNDYTRAIECTQPASRATWVTYAAPVTGAPQYRPMATRPSLPRTTPGRNTWKSG